MAAAVGPGYQCYSVSALQEGGVRNGQAVAVLYENRPCPVADNAWSLPASEPVLWQPLPGEFGPSAVVSGLSLLRTVTHLHRHHSQPLRKVAERLQAWPDGGLTPVTDTRTSEQLRAHCPPLQHYDPRLPDLRLKRLATCVNRET